jgi:hypothetical protein
MQIIEINTKQLIVDFHQLPFEFYKNDPYWIPYLKQDVEKVFDPNFNKLYKEGGVSIRWLFKDGNGKYVGRVAAFINPKTVDTTNFKTGGIGFFESINDQATANFIFDTCKKWLSEKGIEAMDGPINFGDRNQFWGCQIDSFTEPPIYQMNYNPAYYQTLFENYGFQTYFNQYMYWRSTSDPAQPIFHRKYNQISQDPDFKICNIQRMSIEKVAKDFSTVYNGAWGGHSHFKPIPYETSLKIMKSMWPAVDPEIVIFMYYKEQPVAFYLNLPELNQIFKHVHGDLNWLGKLKFVYHKWRKTTNRMTGIIFGVIQEWHGKGLEAALIVYSEKTIGKNQVYKDTVINWVGDFNPKMLKVIQNLGTTLWRSLITYRYQFDQSKPFERAPMVE